MSFRGKSQFRPSASGPMRSRLAVLLSTLVLFALAPTSAAAQFCTQGFPCDPPQIALSVQQGTFAQQNVQLTIFASDDYQLSMSTWQLWYKGVEVSSWIGTTGAITDPGQAHTSVSATGTFQLDSGSHALISRICDASSPSQCSADTLVVTYTPPPTPPTQATPVLTLAQPNDSRLLDDCATCASATAAYTTPPFFANGAAQGAVLRYSSELAKPTGYVELDVDVISLNTPHRLSIRLRRSDGSLVTLSNGAQEAFVQGATGRIRLAAQYDASGDQTGVYAHRAIVTAYYGSSAPYTHLADSLPVKVLIQNEIGSPYGRGWTVAGIERVHVQADSSVLITDGAGGMQHFVRSGTCGGSPWTCNYTSPIGEFATFVRKVKSGTDTVWTRTDRAGTVTEWSNFGLLASLTDRFGNTMVAEHLTTGGLSAVYRLRLDVTVGGSTVQKYTTFAYSGTTNKLASITLPDGRQSAITVTSGSTGELTGATDPDGIGALSALYSSGRLVRVQGRNRASDSLEYDAFGQLAKLIGPAVVTETQGTVSEVTTIASLRRKLLLDQAIKVDTTAPAAVRSDSAYSRDSSSTGTTSTAWGHASGAPAKMRTRSSSGQTDTTIWSYNSDYRPTFTSGTGRGGQRLTWSGALLTAAEDVVSGLVTTYHYTTFDQIDSVRVGGVRQLRNFFPAGALAPDSTRTDTANVVRYTYDSRGRVLTIRDAYSATLTNTYETTHGQVSSAVRTAAGIATATTSFTYDGSGRPLTVTDPLNGVLTSYRDALNRDTLQIAPLGARTRYTHNDTLRVYSVVDPMAQEYAEYVNERGWTVRQIDPRGKIDSLWYDRHGQLTKHRNRRGDVIRVSYDSLGRVTQRTGTLAADNSVDTTMFAYAGDKSWAAARNAESIDTMQVDAAGRPTLATIRRGGKRFLLNQSYTLGNLPEQITLRSINSGGTELWNRMVYTAYDASRRPNGLIDFGGAITQMIYDKAGLGVLDTLPTSTTLSARVRRTSAYNAASQIYSQLYSGNASAFGRYYGQYDKMGRLGSISTLPATPSMQRTHEFDALGRLKNFRDIETTSWLEIVEGTDPECYYCIVLDTIVHYEVDTLRFETFVYDSVANRRDRSAVLATGNRVTSVDGWSLEYDDAGFLTKKFKYLDTLVYSWNALGQLKVVRASSPASVTTYGYDGLGRRVRKTVNSVGTWYLLDGDRVLIETDTAGTPVGEYSYYPGADRPHAMKRGGVMYYYAQDAQGNVIGLISATGTVSATYDYKPYGESIATTGSVVNPYRYKGREWDAEARLYFMRARYYDPHLGRFIAEDPIGLVGGINPMTFVGGNPVSLRDPSGLAPCRPEVEGDGWMSIFYDEKWWCAPMLEPVIINGGRGGRFSGPAGWSTNFLNPNARGVVAYLGDFSYGHWEALASTTNTVDAAQGCRRAALGMSASATQWAATRYVHADVGKWFTARGAILTESYDQLLARPLTQQLNLVVALSAGPGLIAHGENQLLQAAKTRTGGGDGWWRMREQLALYTPWGLVRDAFRAVDACILAIHYLGR